MSDRLPGGLADDRVPEDFDPEALRQGIDVEMEHTDDPDVAREIAMDHLTEDPRYYEKLAILERSVSQRSERDRTYVEGDDLLGILTDVAVSLLDRKDVALGTEVLRWISEV